MEGKMMTYQAATAYACVAYRIMAYEGTELSEEYLDILMDILYEFYTAEEIQEIYVQNIQLDSYEAVMEEKQIKRKINE